MNRNREALRSGGKRLRIVTDSRQATGTIPNTVGSMGYRAEVEKVEGYYRITISGRE